MHRSARRERFPDRGFVRRHRLCVGEVVNQITNYKRLALCVIERRVREGGAREVAKVRNKVSGRKEDDGEKKANMVWISSS